jgi:hypothetical protein
MMIKECGQNEEHTKAANPKDDCFSAELLFIELILQQQELI